VGGRSEVRGGGADQCLDGSLYHKNSERLGRCCWAVMVRDEGWAVLVAVVCLTSEVLDYYGRAVSLQAALAVFDHVHNASKVPIRPVGFTPSPNRWYTVGDC
jgi:hypothetical protein